MNIAVECEESQTVTKAFRARGHNAYSFDIQPCSGGHPEWHIIEPDVDKVLRGGWFVTESGDRVYIDAWDMLIAFPPCTYLSYAGKHVWDAPGREELRQDGLRFFLQFANAMHIPRRVVENPMGYPQEAFRPADQIIHPYYFGDPAMKRTCLWLFNVPPLLHSAQDTLFETKTHTAKPEPVYVEASGKRRHFTDSVGSGKDQKKIRSTFWPGIAQAMSVQWGDLPVLTKR